MFIFPGRTFERILETSTVLYFSKKKVILYDEKESPNLPTLKHSLSFNFCTESDQLHLSPRSFIYYFLADMSAMFWPPWRFQHVYNLTWKVLRRMILMKKIHFVFLDIEHSAAFLLIYWGNRNRIFPTSQPALPPSPHNGAFYLFNIERPT